MRKTSERLTGGNHKEFGGLINQGATCYLNTLLQTLYMTPEVKEAIISFIETTDEKINKDTSICYQLKVLFTELDAKKIANTNGITRNLDMSQQDVLKQQDIEEYFRRLLNKVATESDGSSNILQFYHSKMINSLKCLECNIEAPEECILLDIPLPIRSFDRPIRFQSVNESLEEFLKVETLSGDNLCYCETCEKKTVTETRYYFESLPQILVLQLKRFEFDYSKMCFTKLQDCIEIPATLKFQKKNRDIDKTEWSLISLEAQEQEGPLQSNNHINNDCDESPEPRKDESQQSYTTYELFAICDHFGGYGSGHYVARIKPVSSSKWYCFDDTYVTEIEDFISGGCHGSTVSTSGMPCERSSTAYMLMYRKEEVSSNQAVINSIIYKENRNATQIKRVTEKNTSNLDESVIGNNEKLKEELLENNADEKNVKEGKKTEEENLHVKTEEMENNGTVQEREHTAGQKEMEIEQEERKRMEQTSQSEGSQRAKRVEKPEIEQLQGRKEEIGIEQSEYNLEREEKQITVEKESQEEETRALLEKRKQEKGRREKKSEKNVEKPKRKNKSEDLQENKIEDWPETENGMAENRNNKKGFKKFWKTLKKKSKNLRHIFRCMNVGKEGRIRLKKSKH